MDLDGFLSTPEEVEDTLRHEIAHAIDHERRGRTNHDRVWKTLAVACGARPERTFKGDLPDDSIEAAYRAVCPSCGATSGMHRQPIHARRCRACHAARRPAYLAVTHAASGRVIWPGGATPGVFGGWVEPPSCRVIFQPFAANALSWPRSPAWIAARTAS